MNLKKFIALVLSSSLLIFHNVYAEGGVGKEPEINYDEVVSYFRSKQSGFGDASGSYVYSRGDVRGKKRDVYIFNLPKIRLLMSRNVFGIFAMIT